VTEVVVTELERYGFPFSLDRNIIPDDDTTLFVSAGMQRFKPRFRQPDGQTLSTLQSCIRTNDIDLVGDGTHLTYFEMLGNFSFNGVSYEQSVELWHSILTRLHLPVSHITVHPTQDGHRRLWERLGYVVRPDEGCQWSDGEIGGYCCEVFVGDLEIGNLVNPLEHSTDVGFGWERLHQVVERVNRVDESSLFGHGHPILKDHVRAIESMRYNGVRPGNKGREYVCRRLLRRMLPLVECSDSFAFQDWLDSERELREKRFREGRRLLKRHGDKPDDWWWDTLGILPEERKLL
jgi:hypothetical protein